MDLLHLGTELLRLAFGLGAALFGAEETPCSYQPPYVDMAAKAVILRAAPGTGLRPRARDSVYALPGMGAAALAPGTKGNRKRIINLPAFRVLTRYEWSKPG
jgi:hypothetical protein